MKKKVFISKVLSMSAVMFLLNISNICYSIFISRKAGAEGIGMFHLVMSVYTFGVTVSISGIGLTATRLISDMPSPLAIKCADSIVAKCIKVCLVPASLAFFILYFFSDIISVRLLSNPYCSICLKFMAPTLICTAVSSVINGYFTAFGKIGSIAFGRLMSDLGVWVSTILLLGRYSQAKIYIAVVIAFCTGIILECMCNIILWLRARNPMHCKETVDYISVLRLCTPLAIGSYLRTGLISCENILIPFMLSLFGVTNAVASYGIIKGMTLPVLMFPTVFTGAFTSLIVPEIARRRSMGYKNGIRYISSLSVEFILRFAFLVSAVYLKWYKDITGNFFTETDAGIYLKMLSFLPIFLFLDSVVDSILKGMDKQVTSLKINIVDSVCRVIFIIIFIPRYGMIAYIAIMYISEIINLGFSYITLKKSSNLSFPFKKGVAVPLISIVICEFVSKLIPFSNLWASICFYAAIYILSLSFLTLVLENAYKKVI